GTLLELKPESKALEKYMESLVKDPKTAVATLTGPQAGVIGNWVKSLPAERAGKVHLIFASALKSAGQREVETLLSLLSAPSWPSPASSEVMKEFNSFLFGLKMGRAGAQKSELVLDFGKKYYSGNLDFLPALEFVLNNRRDTQIQIKTEAALLEMYPHNGEVFAKLGARIFELPSNTDKKMLQAYSFNRVLMQDGERSGSVAKKILMGLGEMDPELKAKFSEWYKNAGKPAENVELGLALGEHDPELRKLAAMDLIKGIDASRPGFADLAYATPHVEIPVLHENLFDCDAAFAGVVH
ncbi:MAG: hypothetical protein ACXWQO_03715, partial [Bdellovibrionota bacterium]